jgi:holin-like protein
MIAGLVRILLFQGAGEVVSHFALPMIPGPVIGLVLLLAWFGVRGRVEEPVDAVASALVQNLGLLFVPAAVGVVGFVPQLAAYAGPLALALVASVAATIAVTALVLRFLSRGEEAGE